VYKITFEGSLDHGSNLGLPSEETDKIPDVERLTRCAQNTHKRASLVG
jgi:hypothetical protein